MRTTGAYFLVFVAMGCSVINPSSSQACRMVFPGAPSKSIEANFAYFDHVLVIQVIKIEIAAVTPSIGRGDREYVKLRVVKSYKGQLPTEFYVERSSGAGCGQDFREGGKYLAFFDTVKNDDKLTNNPNLPVLYTSLVDFSASHMIRINDLAAADKMLNLARQQ